MKIAENLLTFGKRNRSGQKIIELKAVVMHWLAAAGQKPVNTRAWWESEQALGSAHYVIGTDGFILQTIPEGEAAWHTGTSAPDPASGKVYTDRARELFPAEAFSGKKNSSGYIITPNFYSIGIEMSHVNMEPGDFSDRTLEAAAGLCADILRRHNKTAEILATHHEVAGWKDCPRLWTRMPELFEEFKGRVEELLENITTGGRGK